MSKVYTTNDLIASFVEEHPELVGHLPYDIVDKVCKSEFQLIKYTMEEGNFEEVRLQYLFTLRVSPPKVMKHLRMLGQYLKPTSDMEKHIRYSDLLLNNIKNNLENFRKYEERIERYTGYSFQEIREGRYIGNGYKRNPDTVWDGY